MTHGGAYFLEPANKERKRILLDGPLRRAGLSLWACYAMLCPTRGTAQNDGWARAVVVRSSLEPTRPKVRNPKPSILRCSLLHPQALPQLPSDHLSRHSTPTPSFLQVRGSRVTTPVGLCALQPVVVLADSKHLLPKQQHTNTCAGSSRNNV
jgi:hypothetical protein